MTRQLDRTGTPWLSSFFPQQKAVKGKLPTTFNEAVRVDLSEVKDADCKKHTCLAIVDDATGYCRVRLLSSKRSEEVVEEFYSCWVEWAGVPTSLLIGEDDKPGKVVYDQGREFVGGAFCELLEKLGCRSEVVALEAPWQGGVVERHNGVFKEMLNRVVYEKIVRGLSAMKIAVSEVTLAKNSLAKSSGFSPQQMVLGSSISLPASVIDRPLDRASHNRAMSDETWAWRLGVHEAARQAWAAADNSDRLRRALLRKGRPMRGPFYRGTLVYFWRQARVSTKKAKGTRPAEAACWHGPCTVVCQDTESTLFVSWRGTLVRVAPEQLRLATSEEHGRLAWTWASF
jgi:hypothetical protein